METKLKRTKITQNIIGSIALLLCGILSLTSVNVIHMNSENTFWTVVGIALFGAIYSSIENDHRKARERIAKARQEEKDRQELLEAIRNAKNG